MVTSSAGRPTVSKTMTIVTRPACGMPAAPIEAAVAVTLNRNKQQSSLDSFVHKRHTLDCFNIITTPEQNTWVLDKYLLIVQANFKFVIYH